MKGLRPAGVSFRFAAGQPQLLAGPLVATASEGFRIAGGKKQ